MNDSYSIPSTEPSPPSRVPYTYSPSNKETRKTTTIVPTSVAFTYSPSENPTSPTGTPTGSPTNTPTFHPTTVMPTMAPTQAKYNDVDNTREWWSFFSSDSPAAGYVVLGVSLVAVLGVMFYLVFTRYKKRGPIRKSRISSDIKYRPNEVVNSLLHEGTDHEQYLLHAYNNRLSQSSNNLASIINSDEGNNRAKTSSSARYLFPQDNARERLLTSSSTVTSLSRTEQNYIGRFHSNNGDDRIMKLGHVHSLNDLEVMSV